MFPKRKESSNDIILFTLAKSADGELSGYHPKKKKTLILFSDFVLKLYRLLIDYFHHSIMQYFLGRRGGGGVVYIKTIQVIYSRDCIVLQ